MRDMAMKKSLFAALAALAAVPLFAGRPVAAWDVVPHQRVTGTFKAGVVAFHDKGVSVEFTINGKKFFVAKEASLNERTGVVEYVAPFPAGKLSAKLGDRGYLLGAKVVSSDGAAHVLPDIVVYANGRSTLGTKKTVWVDALRGNEFADGSEAAPVKSLAQGVKKAGDGGTVYLKEGSYSLRMLGGGLERKFWTLVTPAPGTDRSKVEVFAGRPGTDKLHFKDLNLSCSISDGEYGAIVMGEDSKSVAWFENCTFSNAGGRESGQSAPFGNRLVAYVTGGATSGMTFGPAALLLRGHKVSSVSSKAFPGTDALVVNCTAEDVTPVEGGASSDFMSVVPALPKKWAENLIVYGLKASAIECQVFSIQRLRDSAFVNVSFTDVAHGNTVASSASDEMENVIFSKFSLPDQTWRWRYSKSGRGDFKPSGVIVKDSEFGAMEGYEVRDGSKGLELRDCVVKGAE